MPTARSKHSTDLWVFENAETEMFAEAHSGGDAAWLIDQDASLDPFATRPRPAAQPSPTELSTAAPPFPIALGLAVSVLGLGVGMWSLAFAIALAFLT